MTASEEEIRSRLTEHCDRWTTGSLIKDGVVAKGDEPPHDGHMDERIAKLEAIIPTLATKSDVSDLRVDLHKGQSEVKGWFIATALLVLVGMFTIANIMISNVRTIADNRPTTNQSSQQPAPIIIQIPAAPPADSTAPQETKK